MTKSNNDMTPWGKEGNTWWECPHCGDYATMRSGATPPECSCGSGMWHEEDDEDEEITEPDFDDVQGGLNPGVYDAKHLNPPSGPDCTHLLVRVDRTLGWCYGDGHQFEDDRGHVSRFSVEDLCGEEDT